HRSRLLRGLATPYSAPSLDAAFYAARLVADGPCQQLDAQRLVGGISLGRPVSASLGEYGLAHRLAVLLCRLPRSSRRGRLFPDQPEYSPLSLLLLCLPQRP